jgi:hypothetical protein
LIDRFDGFDCRGTFPSLIHPHYSVHLSIMSLPFDSIQDNLIKHSNNTQNWVEYYNVLNALPLHANVTLNYSVLTAINKNSVDLAVFTNILQLFFDKFHDFFHPSYDFYTSFALTAIKKQLNQCPAVELSNQSLHFISLLLSQLISLYRSNPNPRKVFEDFIDNFLESLLILLSKPSHDLYRVITQLFNLTLFNPANLSSYDQAIIGLNDTKKHKATGQVNLYQAKLFTKLRSLLNERPEKSENLTKLNKNKRKAAEMSEQKVDSSLDAIRLNIPVLFELFLKQSRKAGMQHEENKPDNAAEWRFYLILHQILHSNISYTIEQASLHIIIMSNNKLLDLLEANHVYRINQDTDKSMYEHLEECAQASLHLAQQIIQSRDNELIAHISPSLFDSLFLLLQLNYNILQEHLSTLFTLMWKGRAAAPRNESQQRFADSVINTFSELRCYEILIETFVSAARACDKELPIIPVHGLYSGDYAQLIRSVPPLKVNSVWLSYINQFSPKANQGNSSQAIAAFSASFIHFLENILIREEIAMELIQSIRSTMNYMIKPAFAHYIDVHKNSITVNHAMAPNALSFSDCLSIYHSLTAILNTAKHFTTNIHILANTKLHSYFHPLGYEISLPQLIQAAEPNLSESLSLSAIQRLHDIDRSNSTEKLAAQSEAKQLTQFLLQQLNSCQCKYRTSVNQRSLKRYSLLLSNVQLILNNAQKEQVLQFIKAILCICPRCAEHFFSPSSTGAAAGYCSSHLSLLSEARFYEISAVQQNFLHTLTNAAAQHFITAMKPTAAAAGKKQSRASVPDNERVVDLVQRLDLSNLDWLLAGKNLRFEVKAEGLFELLLLLQLSTGFPKQFFVGHNIEPLYALLNIVLLTLAHSTQPEAVEHLTFTQLIQHFSGHRIELNNSTVLRSLMLLLFLAAQRLLTSFNSFSQLSSFLLQHPALLRSQLGLTQHKIMKKNERKELQEAFLSSFNQLIQSALNNPTEAHALQQFISSLTDSLPSSSSSWRLALFNQTLSATAQHSAASKQTGLSSFISSMDQDLNNRGYKVIETFVERSKQGGEQAEEEELGTDCLALSAAMWLNIQGSLMRLHCSNPSQHQLQLCLELASLLLGGSSSSSGREVQLAADFVNSLCSCYSAAKIPLESLLQLYSSNSHPALAQGLIHLIAMAKRAEITEIAQFLLNQFNAHPVMALNNVLALVQHAPRSTLSNDLITVIVQALATLLCVSALPSIPLLTFKILTQLLAKPHTAALHSANFSLILHAVIQTLATLHSTANNLKSPAKLDSQDLQLLSAVFSLLAAAVKYRLQLLIPAFSSFLTALQHGMNICFIVAGLEGSTRESRNDSLFVNYSRILEELGSLNEAAAASSRHYTYHLIYEYVTLFNQSGGLATSLKQALSVGIYNLMKLCTENESQHIYSCLDSTGKALFKTLNHSYNKQFKYQGAV